MKSVRYHVRNPSNSKHVAGIIYKVTEEIRDFVWNSTYLHSDRMDLDSPIYNGVKFQIEEDMR